MIGEGLNNANNSDFEPVHELVALHFESIAASMVTQPEAFDERDAANLDISTGASVAMQQGDKIRKGEDVEKAAKLLRMRARFDEEAFRLMKALDPEMLPYYPDADKNGNPVAVGNKYRWTPDDRHPGSYKEGIVTRTRGVWAWAVWRQAGEELSAYDNTDEDYLQDTMSDIEKEVTARETMVFSKSLVPVQEI